MAGPLFRVRTQLAVAASLRQRGYGILEARRLSQTVDDDLIGLAAATCPPDVGDGLGAIGDGTIIAAIIAFIQSPAGQALIAMLIKLLLGGL